MSLRAGGTGCRAEGGRGNVGSGAPGAAMAYERTFFFVRSICVGLAILARLAALPVWACLTGPREARVLLFPLRPGAPDQMARLSRAFVHADAMATKGPCIGSQRLRLLFGRVRHSAGLAFEPERGPDMAHPGLMGLGAGVELAMEVMAWRDGACVLFATVFRPVWRLETVSRMPARAGRDIRSGSRW